MRGGSYNGVQLRSKIAVELPSECLPNINDLRQIFDDAQTQGNVVAMRHSTGGEASSKRSSHTERTLLQQQQASNFFVDAKTSHAEENIFESKSRNLEFERAKQKFDNPSHLHHQHHHHHREQRERSASGRYGQNSNSGAGTTNSTGSAGNQQNPPNNRANLALPLKSSTAIGGVGSSNIASSNPSNLNSTSSNLSKDDINRQLFEDHSRSSTAGGSGAGAASADSKFFQKDNANANTATGNYSRNSINLDGLKVSDDEVSTVCRVTSSILSLICKT